MSEVLPDDLAPALSEIELVADIWSADARESRYAAERAVAVARLAHRGAATFRARPRSALPHAGCRRRPGRCDIDHVTAYGDGGATACWNLCCLCRRHHRIKTFAPGWCFQLLPDGRLAVRTPSGVSRVTAPPGWCHDPEPDPPWLDGESPPDRLRC